MSSTHVFRMNHICIPVTDIARSRRFYEALGLAKGFERISENEHLQQMICADGSFVELVKTASADVIRFGRSPHFGLQTSDIRATLVDLGMRGIKVIGSIKRGASGVDWVFLEDPDRHLIELTSEVSA
jgi:catechol 2,3-dioxygenase-like lactoylglutathione lyase family enzyme